MKRGRGRKPSGNDAGIFVRLPQSLLDAVEAKAAAYGKELHGEPMGRATAIRVAIRFWLENDL